MTTTAVRETTIKAPVFRELAGWYVRLRAYPVTVYVSDAEVAAAVAKSPPTKDRTLSQIARNIAIGKRCGSYREWPRATGSVLV